MAAPPIRVLNLQSNWLMSEAIATALTSPSLEIVYSGCDVDDAAAIAATQGADLSLIHQSIGADQNAGFVFADQLRTCDPKIKIILILQEMDRASVLRAFRTGATGVLTQNTSLPQLADCVSWVHKGHVWASSAELEYLVSALSDRPSNGRAAGVATLLSTREQQVVDELLAGFTNREIGTRLGLSECTIRNHLYRVFDKVGVYSRVELALWMANHR